ncbi:MAG: 3-deoxy-manno-octulosonate-8-phosphatase KdsC [Chromatiaceae bacterium]|nr:3-deoxy-manno-octulosonate-8-phosphatase KdsC [Gammaproteobacteria bacterium]MCP5305204.1 3-deoxy-manno-octulosonate-8-phosphatase KdsC [Chromatiaceae bacterium]MCP5315163.1 3-deoxy-manno-octulosonate-8-phosphatase KdsC [Chromatiaceae bacterium]
MQDLHEKAAAIRLVIFDVDGVLTDGSLFIGDDGQEYKAFNSKDGHGMVMLQETGVKIAIITGRTSEVVRIRMQSLGIEHVYQGRRAKLPAFDELKRATGLDDAQIAYVGDDVVDLPVMTRVGLAIAVQDAHALAKRHAHWVTPSGGGRGAGREVCELIMDAQGTLQPALQGYLD